MKALGVMISLAQNARARIFSSLKIYNTIFNLNHMTPEQKALEVYSEEFSILFLDVLEKFVAEYDDMANMAILAKANELLDAINDI
jgi:hypothetical protein